MAKLWRIEDDKVMREFREMARITQSEDGKYEWESHQLDRRFIGFPTKEEVLRSVKYWYRRPNVPTLTINFKSGRKISFR